jgi:signal peptidase I
MDTKNKNIKKNVEKKQDDYVLRPEGGSSSEEGNMEGVRNFLSFSIETIRIFIISLIVIFIVRSFIIQPFFVKGASMQPNFSDGDYLIVDEIGYRVGEPKRGDVIVFRYPNDPSEYFIKRVIGLPGESLEIKDNHIIVFNEEHPGGFVLDESTYLPEANTTTGTYAVELKDNEYYVLGDNRTASSDSRRWGALEENYIIGRAWVRAWPFDEFTFFSPATYY